MAKGATKAREVVVVTANARTNCHTVRPTTYDPSHRAMIDRIREGATIRAAAGSVGILERTWHRWRAAVQAETCEDANVVSLVTDAMQAYDEHTASLQRSVALAANEDWKAAAWALDHRRGDPRAIHDAKRARYEAEIAKNRAAGTHVENIRNVTELNDDDLRAEAKRLLDGEGAADGDGTRTTH